MEEVHTIEITLLEVTQPDGINAQVMKDLVALVNADYLEFRRSPSWWGKLVAGVYVKKEVIATYDAICEKENLEDDGGGNKNVKAYRELVRQEGLTDPVARTLFTSIVDAINSTSSTRLERAHVQLSVKTEED